MSDDKEHPQWRSKKEWWRSYDTALGRGVRGWIKGWAIKGARNGQSRAWWGATVREREKGREKGKKERNGSWNMNVQKFAFRTIGILRNRFTKLLKITSLLNVFGNCCQPALSTKGQMEEAKWNFSIYEMITIVCTVFWAFVAKYFSLQAKYPCNASGGCLQNLGLIMLLWIPCRQTLSVLWPAWCWNKKKRDLRVPNERNVTHTHTHTSNGHWQMIAKQNWCNTSSK